MTTTIINSEKAGNYTKGKQVSDEGTTTLTKASSASKSVFQPVEDKKTVAVEHFLNPFILH